MLAKCCQIGCLILSASEMKLKFPEWESETVITGHVPRILFVLNLS